MVKISESEKNSDKLYFCCTECKCFKWYDGREEEEISRRRRVNNLVREEVDNRGGNGSLVRQLQLLSLINHQKIFY